MVKLTMKTILGHFLQETSCHGWKNIGDSNSSILYRLMWALVFVGMLTGLVYTLSKTYQGYAERRVLTVSTTEQQSFQPFPSITICNRGQISNKSGLITNEVMKLLLSSFQGARYDWSTPKAQDIANISATELEESIAFNWTDIIQGPSFDYVELNKHDRHLFATRDSILGRCVLINGPLSAKMYGGFNVTSSGSEYALTMILNTMQQHYIPTPQSDAGFEVFVHEPNDLIDVTNGGILLSPGTFTKIGLTSLKYKLLPYPFKSFGDEYCEEDHSDRIRTINQQNGYEEYSRTTCFFDCAARRTVEMCECNAIFQNSRFYGNTIRNCTLYEINTCYLPIFNRLKYGSDACDCPRLCRYVTFETTISHSLYPSLAGIQYQRQETGDPYFTEKNARENLLLVSIFYKDMFSRETKHVPEFDFDRVFGSVGGQMGLFLGASLVSAFELVLVIFQVIANSFTKLCNVGNNKNTASVNTVLCVKEANNS